MSPRSTVALLLASAGLAFAACGFPDIEFASAISSEAGAAGDGSGSDNDGAPGADGGSKDAHDELPPDVDPTGVGQDAATHGDADTTVDAAGCTTCDCDHDNVLRNDGGCPGGPGGVYDCDDTDTFIPHSSFVSDFKWPSKVYTTVYDWNCDGKVDKQYRYDVKCGLLADCTAEGFSTNPGCGIEADYIHCKDSLILGIACTEDTAKREKRVQSCR